MPAAAALDWTDLQFFVAVAEAASVTRAAQALGVNHSTVLRRLAALESALGSRLFDRLPGGYALTASGNALAEHLGGAAAQIESARRQLGGLAPAIEGPVRVVCDAALLPGWLLPRLARFRRRHRGVTLQLRVAATAQDAAHADLVVSCGDAGAPRVTPHPDAADVPRVRALCDALMSPVRTRSAG